MNCCPRPNIVISRCIEFDHCRYDGSMIASDFVAALKPHAHFIPVCAEMEIGPVSYTHLTLPTNREV